MPWSIAVTRCTRGYITGTREELEAWYASYLDGDADFNDIKWEDDACMIEADAPFPDLPTRPLSSTRYTWASPPSTRSTPSSHTALDRGPTPRP